MIILTQLDWCISLVIIICSNRIVVFIKNLMLYLLNRRIDYFYKFVRPSLILLRIILYLHIFEFLYPQCLIAKMHVPTQFILLFHDLLIKTNKVNRKENIYMRLQLSVWKYHWIVTITHFTFRYGEIVHINLVRDKDTGKSRGFCFICYEDQRSTVLAVDNFNGIKILNRILRVDHVSNYKVPKNAREEAAKAMPPPAPATPVLKVETPLLTDVRETLADQIVGDIKLPPRLPIYPIKEENKSSTEKVNFPHKIILLPMKEDNVLS